MSKLQNLEQALLSLKEAIDLPIERDRDIAGIIQCFEYTFELFWKTFQELNEKLGRPSSGPRESLEKAFEIGLITNDLVWAAALKDRNLTVHAYDKKFAIEMIERIKARYLPEFVLTIELLLDKS